MARVQFYWPNQWRDASYRTRDGIMPFGLFWLYVQALDATLAFDRVHLGSATSHAINLAFSKQEDGLPESLRDDMAAAYLIKPER